MTEEEKQAGTAPSAAGAATEPTAPAGQVESSAASTPSTLDVEALKAEIEAKIKAEYEGKGGKMAKLQSRLAQQERELTERQRGEHARAQQLLESGDSDGAARILVTQNEALLRAQSAGAATAEARGWGEKIVTDLGAEWDDETEQLAAETIYQGPEWAFDFQQKVAKLARDREREARIAAEKKLKDTVDGLPAFIKQEVAQAITGKPWSSPDASEGGGRAPSADFWKKDPDARMKDVLEREAKERLQQGR